MTKITSLALNLLGLNCGTQIRVRQNDDTVKKYFETMDRAGSNEMFPPILVFRDIDGSHWIADGHHRVAASNKAKLVLINAEVREGTRRDALEAACTANRDNPLHVTTEDRKHAMGMLLKASSDYTDGALADLLGVNRTTIMRWRKDSACANAQVEKRTGKDGKSRKAKYDRKPKATKKVANTAPPPEPPLEPWEGGCTEDTLPPEVTSQTQNNTDIDEQDEAVEELWNNILPVLEKAGEAIKAFRSVAGDDECKSRVTCFFNL